MRPADGRSPRSAAGASQLHSLPTYHGLYVALWCLLPALLVLVLWMLAEPHILRALIIGACRRNWRNLADNQLGLVLNDIQNIAAGNAARAGADPAKLAAADHLLRLGAS